MSAKHMLQVRDCLSFAHKEMDKLKTSETSVLLYRRIAVTKFMTIHLIVWHILIKTTYVNLMVEGDKKSQGIIKVKWSHPLITMNVCKNF